ncbi:MAG: von Willebrand factor type A domain-containing protein [Lentisphaerales bacterium]|nr:von Willebrand factor type A domain-containing protein [Lentisphaerales bacterium]
MSKCCDIEIEISEMVLGEVSQETAERVHAHIAGCESCMGFYLSMIETFDPEVGSEEVEGLTQNQKMAIFQEAKKVDSKNELAQDLRIKKFPWHVVISVAAALVIAAYIILPKLSGAHNSARATYEEAKHRQEMMLKESPQDITVSMEDVKEVVVKESPAPEMRQRLDKGKAHKPQKKFQQFDKVSSDRAEPIIVEKGLSNSPVLTTVQIDNLETNDYALEDVSDEQPSTDDNSMREALSDVVLSPGSFTTTAVSGERGGVGVAPRVKQLGELGKKVKEYSDSKNEKGLNLLLDGDQELNNAEEKVDKLLADNKNLKDNTAQVERRPMLSATGQTQSTFSIDVDTAGYQIAKSQIENNLHPDPNVLRAEEFINYQNYNYEVPQKETFNIQADMTVSPFHKGSNILRIGIQGRRPGGDVKAQNNFMFIVDTSGSMADDGRLPLAKKVITMIVDQMQAGDKVSLIAGGLTPRLVLDNVDASQKGQIKQEVKSLNAVGATNLEANIIEGYQQAAQNLAPNTYNRVVLMSDGVANLGDVSAQNILKQLEDSKDQGIGMTVVGMGSGDYNDNFLEQLANKGDGNYVFIEDSVEAQKTFEQNFAQTFHTIANNVKIQVDFDPQQVARYRLLGYENRRLKNEDFRNDKVDAGEVGSGQSVTAIYELELTQEQKVQPMAVINMRYKDARDNLMKEQKLKVQNRVVSDEFNKAPASLRLAFLSGKFAEVLKRGGLDEGITVDHLLKYMRPLAAELNNDPNVQEMLQLMNKSK